MLTLQHPKDLIWCTLKSFCCQVGGKAVLRFALAYGFRNIQTLLRKVKPGLSQYDYVEVMACPLGCINGGGQLPHPPGESMQESIAKVDASYHHPQVCFQAAIH